MRLRGVVVLALTTTACAAVIGLGDYDVEPEGADAGLGNETGGASSSSGAGTSSSGALIEAAADANIDDGSSDAAVSDADAAVSDARADGDAGTPPTPDAGPDAGVSRDGVACADTSNVCAGTCCHRRTTGSFSCIATTTCEGAANGDPFECDDRTDCKSGQICCVYIGTDQRPQASFCNASCSVSQRRACLSDSDCQGSGSCLPPVVSYPTALPLMKICR